MEASKFLVKAIGLYLIVSGFWLVVQRSGPDTIVQNFAQSPALVAFSDRQDRLLLAKVKWAGSRSATC
jgi:hypothetical protein